MEERVKRILSLFSGLVTTFFQMYGAIIGLVCSAIIFDIVSGIVGSKASGKKITSKKANQGFWKKVSVLLALAFGMFLDAFIPLTLEFVDVQVPFNMPFGLTFGCYIVFNESISICENIYKVNPTILPNWVKNMLLGSINALNNDDEKGGK